MAMKNESNTAVILTSLITGSILLVVLIFGLQAWFLKMQQQEEDLKYFQSPNTALANLHMDQQARVNSYRWIDRDKQVVAIPIDEAMKLLVQKGKKP